MFTSESTAPSDDDDAGECGADAALPAGWPGGVSFGSLLRTIESEIIPRLLLAHRQSVNDDRVALAGRDSASAGEVVELTNRLLAQDTASAQAYARALRQEGLSIESLYLQLLAPAARRLGELWEADRCDFTQVTVGLWRLQQIVHEHGGAFARERPTRATGPRALLLAAPGSQHTFGLLLVGEFFRRAGWQVAGDPSLTLPAALDVAARDRFELFGLSVGSECHVDAVSSAILALRKASLNPGVVVVVGGPIANLVSDFVERVGADATAPDAAAAVSVAERLVKQSARPV